MSACSLGGPTHAQLQGDGAVSAQFYADVARAVDSDREDGRAIAVLVVRETTGGGLAFSLLLDPPTAGEGEDAEPAPHRVLMAFVQWMTDTMQLGETEQEEPG